MQIDSVRLRSLYSIRPNDHGRVQPEDREQLRNSPTHQERLIGLKDILANNTSLSQLLDAGSQPGASVEKVSINKPELETDDGDVYALPEDVQRQGHINRLAMRIDIYERDRRNAAMRIADKKLDELLKNVNILLQNTELTDEQSVALKIFNSKINQAKKSFDRSSPKFFVLVQGFSADELFAGLESAFDVLSESFSWAEGSMPVQFDQIKSSFKETLDVPDITEEEILSVLAKYIETYEIEERAMEDQQLVQDSMPEIIESVKKFRPDFCVATKSQSSLML